MLSKGKTQNPRKVKLMEWPGATSSPRERKKSRQHRGVRNTFNPMANRIWPKGQMGKDRFIDVLLSRIETVQGRAQLLPSGLPFQLIGEDVNRILNGLHVVLDALVQTHQKGPFVTVQRTTDFDALAVLVPPISWHRHTEAFPPFDTPKLEGCNGATFGLGRTEEKDGDVHELGRRD